MKDSQNIPTIVTFLGRVVSAVALRATIIVIRIFRSVDNYMFNGKKALYGSAVLRILFGVTGLGLLITNFRTRLYSFGSGSAWNGEISEPVSEFPKILLFSWFHRVAADDMAFTLMYIVLIVLAILFTLGWRFRFVLPVYFILWVSFIEMNDMLGDQGDNMYRITMVLLFFADPAARWSLDARRRSKQEWFRTGNFPQQVGTVLHNLALVALAAQVIFVYTAGALFKAGGEPWAQGRAVYDPLATARFGTWPALTDLLTTWGPLVSAMTLGSVFLQAAFPFMLLRRSTRVVALVGMLSFHIGIAVLMGLPWFSLAMIAIDAIFISDKSWARVSNGVKTQWEMSRSTSPPQPQEEVTTSIPVGV